MTNAFPAREKKITAGSDRPSSTLTRSGTVRGEHCKAIIKSWRTAKELGDSFCKNPPMENGFCKQHQFVATPTKARTRGQQVLATRVAIRYKNVGNARKVTAVRALKELIEESAGNVDYLRDEVNKLEKLVIAGRKTREEIAGVVVLYNEERDRHERFVTDAIRIRLEERQQEINAAQALVLATVAKAIIDGIGLKGEDRQRALAIASHHLLEAGATAEEGLWRGPLQEAVTPTIYKGVGRSQTVIDVPQREAVG